MSFRPNDIYSFSFPTYNISGISSNTDSVPWGTLVKNGIDDFSSKVFLTNVDVGRYIASGTVPNTYSIGNYVQVCISGQVGGLLSKNLFSLGALDSYVSWDYIGIEPGINAKQSMQAISAVIAGTSSGINNTIWYNAISGASPRLSAAAISGIRSVINYF